MAQSPHYEHLVGKNKNEWTLKLREGDKVKTIDSVKILYMDAKGVTVEEMKHVGKNRRLFVPMLSLISLRQEFI